MKTVKVKAVLECTFEVEVPDAKEEHALASQMADRCKHRLYEMSAPEFCEVKHEFIRIRSVEG